LDETDKNILQKVTEGKTQKQIANDLYCKRTTIENRLRALRKHFKCNSTPQLIAHVIEADII
jgi:DNA-binding NarL/FixJ family response regulator